MAQKKPKEREQKPKEQKSLGPTKPLKYHMQIMKLFSGKKMYGIFYPFIRSLEPGKEDQRGRQKHENILVRIPQGAPRFAGEAAAFEDLQTAKEVKSMLNNMLVTAIAAQNT